VNLERALCFGDRLGGHLVSGHVDGVATVTRRFTQENAIVFVFATDADILRFIVEKGSVAIDGISLTVNAVGEQDFSVSIIPHSLEQTTLKERKVGDRVNIETDLIGKYVARLLVPKGTKGNAERGGMDLEFLARNGFL
jgi:riboflavin synthase